MSPNTFEHPETGEVYQKPFRLENTPIPDILAMLALGGSLTVVALLHSHPISMAWPSPLALPYVQLAEQLLGQTPTTNPELAGVFPLYSYLIASLMSLKGTTVFQAYSPILLGINIGAYVLSMTMLYNAFRQGLGYIGSLLLVLLIACSPLVLNTVTALSPAPLLWMSTLILLFLLQVLKNNRNLFLSSLGTVLAVVAGFLHPYGLCLLAAWNMSLLCLGFVGTPLVSITFALLISATLPGVNLLAVMTQSFNYAPSNMDSLGSSSTLAPLQERVQGFFGGVNQLGKVLLLAPDPNLQEWPIQQTQESWFAVMLNNAYLGLSGMAILSWPLGVLFAVLAMIKALYIFVRDREVIGGLFLSWTLFFAVCLSFFMPKLVTGSVLSLAFLLPVIFIFGFVALKSLGNIPLLQWSAPVLRTGVVGLATVCVLLFQARVGYNHLASVYETNTNPSLAPSQAMMVVEAGTQKPSEGFNLVAINTGAPVSSPRAGRLDIGERPSTQSLQAWVNQRIPASDCFLSSSPVKDSFLVGRPVYVLGTPYLDTGLSGVDVAASGFACPYFIEHKEKRDEYDWIRQEQYRRNGVRLVFEDGKAQGLRVWRLRSS
ncbi:MAG: hypothetical protein ACK551_02420 [Vampirovibrionales bacterium]